MNIPVQTLAQANNISNVDAMLQPGTQLTFPDAFGGSLLQMLLHAFGLDGSMPLPPPRATAQPQSVPSERVGSAGAARPMRHRASRSVFKDPVGAVQDRVRQFRGQPQDGEARPAAEDGQPDRAVKTPHVSQTDPAAQAGADARGDVRVNTPHITQWNSTACKLASDRVVRNTGGTPGEARIAMATSRPGRGGGRDATVNVDPAGARAGLDRINRELDRGHAVEVGVAHDRGGNHNDGITDHFVAVTGRGTDEQGRRYYTFHDPATRHGADTNPRNRFYVDPDTGGLYRPGSSNPMLQSNFLRYRYEVTTVR